MLSPASCLRTSCLCFAEREDGEVGQKFFNVTSLSCWLEMLIIYAAVKKHYIMFLTYKYNSNNTSI